MAIVDYNYYTSEYMGDTVAGGDFAKAESRAERLIELITHGRAANFAVLPEFQQTAIKRAICAQIEYYALNGLDVSVNGETTAGWTVGRVRVDGGSAAKATGAVSMVCAAAVAELEQTGLLNGQVATFGEPPRVPLWWWG